MVLPSNHSKFRSWRSYESHLSLSSLLDFIRDRYNPFKTCTEILNIWEALDNNKILGISDWAIRKHLSAIWGSDNTQQQHVNLRKGRDASQIIRDQVITGFRPSDDIDRQQ